MLQLLDYNMLQQLHSCAGCHDYGGGGGNGSSTETDVT